MTTETSVTNLKINKVTKAQYDTITRSSTEAYEITDLGSILDGKQTTSNLVTTISASSTDAQYPSAKCVYDALQSGGGGLSYTATCPAITPTSGVASWSVTHNLGTANIIVSLYNTSGALQECNVTITSANAITVNFKASSNVSAGDYKIVVLASGANADTSNLADKGLSNLTNAGKIKVADYASPSSTREQLTVGANGTSYQAPADGWFWMAGASTSNYGFIYMTNSKFATQGHNTNGGGINIFLPVAKNDSITYHLYDAFAELWFVYAKGSESEAS